MSKLYLIEDDFGDINLIATEQGLIEYANQAHFIEECGKAEDVGDAIEILRTDFFTVKEIGNIYDIGENKMDKERLEKLLNECVGYLAELKERDSLEEKTYFWKNVIGMTDEEISYFLEKEN